VLVFINDILVYSANRHEHKENLKTVLEVLGEKKLFAKLRSVPFGWKRYHAWVMLSPRMAILEIQKD
jgi:hypothetical protein